MDFNIFESGTLVVLLLGGVIWAIEQFLPKILADKVHALFSAVKASPWFRDPKHPKRARWLLATAELLEDEIPDPGEGKEFYKAAGAAVAGIFLRLAGTASKWAAALEKIGDAVDLQLDTEIEKLAAKK